MTTPKASLPAFESYPVRRRLIHAPSPLDADAIEAVQKQALRRSAVAADVNATTEVNIAFVWRALAGGASTIVDGFFCERRCYLVLAPNIGAGAGALERRRLQVLQLVLSGLPQKNVASDLGLAASTIALNARRGLESFGVNCKPSRAHPLLMLAARAASEASLITASTTTLLSPDHRELRVLSVARPDLRLGGLLPPAELAVIRDLVEGLPYARIAARRGTSTRTVANQIAAVFRRRGVSGRNELVHRLFLEDASTSPPAPRNPVTLAPLVDTAEPEVSLELAARRSA